MPLQLNQATKIAFLKYRWKLCILMKQRTNKLQLFIHEHQHDIEGRDLRTAFGLTDRQIIILNKRWEGFSFNQIGSSFKPARSPQSVQDAEKAIIRRIDSILKGYKIRKSTAKSPIVLTNKDLVLDKHHSR